MVRTKPKAYVEFAVRSLVPKLTKLCAIEKAPYVTFSKSEIKRMGLKRYSNLGNRYDGMCWWKQNVIYISPRKGTEETRNTLYHEFIHLRFHPQGHGKRFEELIKRLQSGEQFKPRRVRHLTKV